MRKRDWWLALYWTAAIEIVTCVLRFGLQLESTRDTSLIGKLTFGYRIHHGYIGVLLCVVALLAFKNGMIKRWLLIAGIALALSDAIHHFGVLWHFEGGPQFHLVYPGQR